jgi:energy-coupling factor transporter ATP-binding protein EcfA2
VAVQEVEREERAPESSPISGFTVRGLYGKFDYRINLLEGVSFAAEDSLFAVNEDRLALIYGSNGTGKTTLLRMLFDGLSAARNRGHRTWLGRLRFEDFSIDFVNGDRVSYTRRDPTTGPFTARATVNGEPAGWEWEPGERTPTVEFDVDVGAFVSQPDTGEAAFLEALDRLAVNPVFLTDTRVLISDLVEPEREVGSAVVSRTVSGRHVERIVERERDYDVRDALNRVREYLRTLILTGAQRGSERVDTVYATLAEAIVTHASPVGRPRKSTIPNLRTRVEALQERAAGFTRYGLLPEPPATRLLAALKRAQPKTGPLLDQVLTPYLDGLTERMEELEPGLRAISGYVDAVDSFLERKRFTFNPARGATIMDETGERLAPVDLSSGEKQILVLFSDVMALRERTRLFLIDEPEISLNPQWQRNLMPALLSTTLGSPMQLLAATHSIEIMAKYRDRIRQLVEIAPR